MECRAYTHRADMSIGHVSIVPSDMHWTVAGGFNPRPPTPAIRVRSTAVPVSHMPAVLGLANGTKPLEPPLDRAHAGHTQVVADQRTARCELKI